jgi:hypothetical protein
MNLLDSYQFESIEEQRILTVQKIFEIIIENPIILIHESKLRVILVEKIDELYKIIDKNVKMFNDAKYFELISIMKYTMRTRIKNDKMRSVIYDHLDKIGYILAKYQELIRHRTFKKILNDMKNTIHTINTTIEQHKSTIHNDNLL